MRKHKITSKRQLAQILGYPYKNINRLFSERYNPRVKELSEHARKIGCKLRDLING